MITQCRHYELFNAQFIRPILGTWEENGKMWLVILTTNNKVTGTLHKVCAHSLCKQRVANYGTSSQKRKYMNLITSLILSRVELSL